jgi:hypothetical protein
MRSKGRSLELGTLWAGDAAGDPTADFQVLSGNDGIFIARSRVGEPALLIEIAALPNHALGRQTAGFELKPYASLSFRHARRSWKAPAAALLCTDLDGIDAFCVLASDVEDRMRELPKEWKSVLAIVEEWQSLLARKLGQGAEWELGLWGELWLLSQSYRVDDLVAGWRGPDRDSTDFFIGGRAVEVKASRQCGCHWISATQVDHPVGDAEAYLLSMWVGPDPIGGCTIAELVTLILRGASDPATAMRRIAESGYSPADRTSYQCKYVLLGEPHWYRIEDVPRIRRADVGISKIRYLATLDEEQRIAEASGLWQHFLGGQYGRAH